MIEKRRYARATIDLPVLFSTKGVEGSASGIAKDIAIGGMFIETAEPAAFSAEILVRIRLPTPTSGEQEFRLPGVVRWVRSGGMGVQFGLLGALETHAITELGKLHQR
ncbi:MAG TPA: PilZ domain-containing protein [Labilithrix sp.]|nr:PilZ domain-containing protein [Labilithrix sp.]